MPMPSRYLFALALFVVAAAPVQAETTMADDSAEAAPPVGQITVSVSYSINVPLAATDDATVAAADATYRRALLKRAGVECADVLDTIATECQVSDISISTQVNTYPGQPPALYVSSTVNLQIVLRDAK